MPVKEILGRPSTVPADSDSRNGDGPICYGREAALNWSLPVYLLKIRKLNTVLYNATAGTSMPDLGEHRQLAMDM